MSEWLVKGYSRYGEHGVDARVVFVGRFPKEELASAVVAALAAKAVELLVIEIRESANKGSKHKVRDLQEW